MDKKFAKKYLLALLIIFIGALVLSTIIVFGIRLSGKSALDITVSQGFLLCLVCSILPVCAYNGFVFTYAKLQNMTTEKPALFVALVLPITILAIPIGAIMLVPNVIKNIKITIDKL